MFRSSPGRFWRSTSYRYIWDGAATLEGASPYRYSPEQVLSVKPDAHLAGRPATPGRLLREKNAALGTILSRVHYGELPTIYPPVSQAVFAIAVFVTPARADVFTHISW